jgi:hypothetical protein
MAVQIAEPNDSNPNTEDWQTFLYRTTMQGGGFMCLFLTNINNSNPSMIQAGSRFEINSTFYQVNDADEAIAGDPVDGAVNYVYAIPQPNSAVFEYSVQEPFFDTLKGGWFSGTMRAVARMICFDGSFYDKVILDSADSMLRHNNLLIPVQGGTLIGEGPVNDLLSLFLNPGVYRYELKGGKGGTGGTGYGGTPADEGEEGEIKTGILTLRENTEVTLSTGGNGENGGNGTVNNPYQEIRSGGGGAATGGTSFIDADRFYLEAVGGAGSNGSKASGGNWANSNGGEGGKKINIFYADVKRLAANNDLRDLMNGRSKYYNAFNKGNAGANASASNYAASGGSPGTTLQNVSSGYSKLYHLWDL